jgi:hypothetical protein
MIKVGAESTLEEGESKAREPKKEIEEVAEEFLEVETLEEEVG